MAIQIGDDEGEQMNNICIDITSLFHISCDEEQ